MACNVCAEKVEICENGNCLNDLEGGFYCYEKVHFCSILCWQAWIADEERSKLEEAEDDEGAE